MGSTLVEKIVAARSGRPHVSPGDKAAVEVDRVFCHGAALAALTARFPLIDESSGGSSGRKPAKPAAIVVAQDQFSGADPGGDPGLASRVRDLVREWGAGRYYELGRGGIPGVLFPEAGLVRPGGVVVGMDHRTAMFGALGALALAPAPEEFDRALMEGKLEVRVPETVRVILNGRLQRWVGGTDLGLHLLGALAGEDLAGKALELAGDAVASLGIADRFALADVLSEFNPACVIAEPDEKARVYARSRCDGQVPEVAGDADAEYVDEIEVDCRRIQPQVMLAAGTVKDAPQEPGRSVNMDRARGVAVKHAVVGGCRHGRLDDIRICAYFLRDYMVSEDVRLTVVPGSQQILVHAMEEGLVQIIIRAGAHVGVPSCRYMRNAIETAARAGEHCIATGHCSAGKPDKTVTDWTSIASPALATVAAVMGAVQTPLDLARNKPRMATGLIL